MAVTPRIGRPRAPRSLVAASSIALVLSSLSVPALTAAAADGDAGTERVSVATGGTPGNGVSHGVDVSGDGSVVAFGSAATNLVPGGTSTFDIYVRDRAKGTTEVVSVNDSGVSGSSTSLWPSISRDGARVVFHSIATNLAAGDDNNQADVFVRDRTGSRTILVSATADGTPANAGSIRAEISADGRHVVFLSSATDLVAGVTSGLTHVYIRHLDTGVVELVSQGSGGQPADAGSGTPSVSGDGRYVVFQTFASNLGGLGYIYVRDTVSGTTSTVAGSSSVQADEPAISGDGSWIFYNNGYRGFVTERTSGTGAGNAINVPFQVLATSRFSDDGRFLALFAEDPASGTYRLYVWDRLRNTSTQASLTDGGTQVASGATAPGTFGPPGISDNGQIVGFWTEADGVVSGDTGGVRDVFVRDRGDLLGPSVTGVTASPPEPNAGEPVQVTASVSDVGRGDAIVAAAEASVDGGAWANMTAVDSSFDSTTEAVTLTLEGLDGGTHEVCVRGTDGRGNVTEDPSCTRFTYATTTTPVGLTITRIAAAGVKALLLDPKVTFYARAWVIPADGAFPSGGVTDFDTRDGRGPLDSILEPGDLASAEPFVNYGEQVTTSSGVALVRIAAGLDLGNGATIPIDLNPTDGQPAVTLSLDLATGRWSDAFGPVNAPVSCMSSDAPDAETLPGELCFGLSTLSLDGDLDGDGLLDSWEQFGLSMDSDPNLELDLPAWGATPDHKDLFVEYDIEDDALFSSNVERGLQLVREAFARAPGDAGGTPNPDGQPGIRLWIDSPSSDPTLTLAGSTAGQLISTPEVCGVKDGFYDVKAQNFDQDRRWVFRYALKESQDSDCAPGGQGEIGGNDFVVFNSDNAGFTKEGVFWPGGQTFMHELGHNLGLLHGGFQNRNHKPNYVSLMNYRYNFTLQEAGGDGYLDFSPAVAPDGEGARPALMPPFAESAPPQGQVLGADRDHLIRYPDLTCLPTSIAATDAFDLQPAEPGPDEPVPHPGSDAYFKDLPDSCTTALASGATQTHEDHDDWSAISLPFREDGDSADGPINPSDDEDLPTDDEIDLLRAQATTSNLKVALAGPATPVQVGSPALVRVTAANAGNVHSATPVITVEMPPGVVVTTIPPACAGNPLVCTSPPLAPGATTTFDLEIRPTAPGSLVVRASLADPRLADSTPADNTAEATVTAVSASTPTPTPTATPTPTPTSTSPALPPTPAPSTSSPPQVPPQLAPSSVVLKSKSYFRYNSTKLTKAQKRKLRALVRQIPDGAAASTVAVGMVRAKGATKADRVRAKARARVVARYLRSAGLTGPIVAKNTGRTKSKTAKARRVNITITYTR